MIGARMMRPGQFRLLLAMVVLLHHFTPIRLGTWAVGLFFCLSGYWIAEMWSQKYSKLDRPYLAFLISRWWRLAPTLFFMTLLVVVLVKLNLVSGDTTIFNHSAWWASQPLIAGSVHWGMLLPPVWSLDVEMQFYFVAPLLMLGAGRLNHGMQLMTLVIALAWCLIVGIGGSVSENARLDVWLGVFLVGMLASISGWKVGPRVAAASGLVIIIFFIVAACVPTFRPWIVLRGTDSARPQPCLLTYLNLGSILLAAPLAIATTAISSGRFDRFLGELSYPLYLFHWIPREWYYARDASHTASLQSILLLGCSLSMSLLGASAILVLVDRPVQRLRHLWIRRRLRSDLAVEEKVRTESPKEKIEAIPETSK